jgi:hypothetical protein
VEGAGPKGGHGLSSIGKLHLTLPSSAFLSPFNHSAPSLTAAIAVVQFTPSLQLLPTVLAFFLIVSVLLVLLVFAPGAGASETAFRHATVSARSVGLAALSHQPPPISTFPHPSFISPAFLFRSAEEPQFSDLGRRHKRPGIEVIPANWGWRPDVQTSVFHPDSIFFV